MLVLSIDIGITHLAHCLASVTDTFQIIDWDVLDLLGPQPTCTHFHKKQCKQPALFFRDTFFFCKKHAVPVPPLSGLTKPELAKLCNLHGITQCETKESMVEQLNTKKLTEVKRKSAKTCSAIDLGKELVKQYERFAKVDVVVIENQIGPLANRMKMLQGMVMQYWIMKHAEVVCVSSVNKLKLFHKGPSTYAERKKISVDCVRKLIIANHWNTGFEKHKKKDDLADTLLQLIWYLNNINADYLKLIVLI
jgi:hypothetical protein